MTTTWSIGQMDRNTANGGVTVAHWRVEAVDGDHAASTYDRTVITALTKAIQEQHQMIQALQTDIAALKGV
jgi:hypothetical protein